MLAAKLLVRAVPLLRQHEPQGLGEDAASKQQLAVSCRLALRNTRRWFVAALEEPGWRPGRPPLQHEAEWTPWMGWRGPR